jgi:hypothetical protein
VRRRAAVSCPWISDLSPSAISFLNGLEYVAQSKEPRSMSGVSDASANEQGPQRRPRDEPGCAVIREFAHAWIVVHFSDLIQCDAVDAPAEERREAEYSVEVSPRKRKN